MSLEINKLELNSSDTIKLWDDFIDNSPSGTFYHKTSWLLNNIGTSFKSAQRYEFYSIVDKNNIWQGIFYISFSKKFGKEFIVMPHMTPYGGIVFAPSIHNLTMAKMISSMKSMNELFINKLKERTLLYFSFSPAHKDMQPFIWNKMTPSIRYTYRLPLKDETSLWSNVQVKNHINKGSKSNVTIKWGYEENLDTFFKLNEESFKKQKVEGFNYELTKTLLDQCHKNNSVTIGILYDEDSTPLGGCVLGFDNHRSYYLMGGISRSNNFAMSYLLWQSILYTKDILKLDEFDFEGSMIPSIEQFFRKFGGNLTPYYTVSHILYLIKNSLL